MKFFRFAPILLLVIPIIVGAQSSQVTKNLSGLSGFADPNSCINDRNSFLESNYPSEQGYQVIQNQELCSCFTSVGQQQLQGQCKDAPSFITSGTSYWWEGIYTIRPPAGGTQTVPQSNGGVPTVPQSPGPVQTVPQGTPTGLVNPLSGTTDLLTLINKILNFIVTTIAPIVIIGMLVYIGFLFATTSVNPDNKNKAKEALAWTLLGALILLGAEAISLGIQATVNALSGS